MKKSADFFKEFKIALQNRCKLENVITFNNLYFLLMTEMAAEIFKMNSQILKTFSLI
jgi:hypothetical protein